jgi:hypothetical protein
MSCAKPLKSINRPRRHNQALNVFDAVDCVALCVNVLIHFSHDPRIALREIKGTLRYLAGEIFDQHVQNLDRLGFD